MNVMHGTSKLPSLAVHAKAAICVHAGADTSGIVSAEGSAYAFGMGSNYQLANGKDKDAQVPGKIAKEVADKVLGMAFGGQHTLLLVKH